MNSPPARLNFNTGYSAHSFSFSEDQVRSYKYTISGDSVVLEGIYPANASSAHITAVGSMSPGPGNISFTYGKPGSSNGHWKISGIRTKISDEGVYFDEGDAAEKCLATISTMMTAGSKWLYMMTVLKIQRILQS